MDKVSVEEAVSRLSELPTLPSVVMQILDSAQDPDSSALTLSELITADQTLSARVLRLVNSAYVGMKKPVSSVTQAVVVLGFREVCNLALATKAFGRFPGGHEKYDRHQLWRHSVATAMAAERCAYLIKTKPQGSFICGLLHDIGKVALDSLFPKQFRDAVQKAEEEGIQLRDAELAVIGMSHPEVGGLLGEKWNLPEPVSAAIRYHHEPEECDKGGEEGTYLTNLTAVANFVTYEVGLGEGGDLRATERPEGALAKLGVSEEMLDDIKEGLDNTRDRIDEVLGL